MIANVKKPRKETLWIIWLDNVFGSQENIRYITYSARCRGELRSSITVEFCILFVQLWAEPDSLGDSAQSQLHTHFQTLRFERGIGASTNKLEFHMSEVLHAHPASPCGGKS